jgi:hypothetical protein
MALNLLDAMVQELQDEDRSASEESINRYKNKWKNVAKSKGVVKEWPCPRCFAKDDRITGRLILLSPCDGMASAMCDRCGPLLSDFIIP